MIKLSFGKYFVVGVTCYLGAIRNWPQQGQLESCRGCRGMPEVGCRRARLGGGRPENLETSPLTSRAARRGSHERCLRDSENVDGGTLRGKAAVQEWVHGANRDSAVRG